MCSLFSGKRIILKSKPDIKIARYTAWQDWKYDHTSEKKNDLCKIDLFLMGFENNRKPLFWPTDANHLHISSLVGKPLGPRR